MKINREGVNHWQNKLSEKDVRWIRRNYDPSKMSKTTLAKKYGVQLSTITRILNGESWKHVKVENKFSTVIKRVSSNLNNKLEYKMGSFDVL